jgi:hypothetical protein
MRAAMLSRVEGLRSMVGMRDSRRSVATGAAFGVDEVEADVTVRAETDP